MFGSQSQPHQVEAECRFSQSYTQLGIPDINTRQGYTGIDGYGQLSVSPCFSGPEWPNMPLTVWTRDEESDNRYATRTIVG